MPVSAKMSEGLTKITVSDSSPLVRRVVQIDFNPLVKQRIEVFEGMGYNSLKSYIFVEERHPMDDN